MEYTFLFSFSLPFAFFALFAVKNAYFLRDLRSLRFKNAYFFLRDAWRA